jgi:hypothetical protein
MLQRLRLLPIVTAAAAALMPVLVHAESDIQLGAGGLSANARLDFQVRIPEVLFLQVGTGTLNASNPAVDLIDFVVPAANVGDGNPIAGAGGDLGGGAVTARVIGNSGDVTLTSFTGGALDNGAGDTISFNEVAATVTALTSAMPLPHPGFVDGGTSANLVVPATNRIVNRDARWTFSYLNTAPKPAGTYGGVNTNNGRVTYTATMP